MAKETKIVKVYNPVGGALTLLNPAKKGTGVKSKKPTTKKNFVNLKKRRYSTRGNPVPIGDTLRDAAGLMAGMLAVQTVSKVIPFGRGNVLISAAIKVGLGIGASMLAEKVGPLKGFSRGIAISGTALALQDALQKFAPNLYGEDGPRLRPMRLPRRMRDNGSMVPPGAPVPALPPAPVSVVPGAPVADWEYAEMGYDPEYYQVMDDEFESDQYFMNDLVTNFPYGRTGLADLVTNFRP